MNLLRTEVLGTKTGTLKYVLVTPARNEEGFIEQTIKSVVTQTALPVKWVIVSDGSTDGTNEIVSKYCALYSWIEGMFLPLRTGRHFAGKVHAFNAGYQRIQNLHYDVLGSLDGDISLDDPEYFAFLLERFTVDPQLGVAGTPFAEDGKTYDYRFSSTTHVSGACQLFRKECFQAIDGYQALPMGCIDLVANTNARMLGWKTQCFLEKRSTHQKKSQSFKHMTAQQAFQSGYVDYLIGVDLMWQALRGVNLLRRPGTMLQGTALFGGFVWGLITRAEKPVSKAFVVFRRREQRQSLRKLIRGFFDWGRRD